MFLFHEENLGTREELRETIQNFINNLKVEAGHKLLCDDPTMCGLIFAWHRFCNFL